MKIRLLAMDVDGTLTDGRIYVGADGEIMKAFDVKDGYGIKHILPRMGIVPVIITGRESKIVEYRCRELGITELHQGVENKLETLRKLAEKYGVTLAQIAYIGDDVSDILCIKHVGLSACPADADDSVRQAVDYNCVHDGGRSAVREFIDYFTVFENET